MNTKPLHMEHRWGTRVELFVPAEVATPAGRSFRAVVRNASLSGALLETLTRLPMLSHIVLKPEAHDADWMQACVVRTDDRGFGVEWLEPVLRSVSTLLALRDRGADVHAAPHLQRDSVSWTLLDRLQDRVTDPAR